MLINSNMDCCPPGRWFISINLSFSTVFERLRTGRKRGWGRIRKTAMKRKISDVKKKKKAQRCRRASDRFQMSCGLTRGKRRNSDISIASTKSNTQHQPSHPSTEQLTRETLYTAQKIPSFQNISHHGILSTNREPCLWRRNDAGLKLADNLCYSCLELLSEWS